MEGVVGSSLSSAPVTSIGPGTEQEPPHRKGQSTIGMQPVQGYRKERMEPHGKCMAGQLQDGGSDPQAAEPSTGMAI